MSNALAIATVTASLKNLLYSAIVADDDPLPEPTVTTLSPGAPGTPATGINVFLYQVTPNAALRNDDLPTRGGGRLISRPRTALDLHYLLSFYGDESRWLPQRLMGIAVRTLHERPVLGRPIIEASIQAEIDGDGSFAFLNASDLADAVERVRFVPEPLSLEDLSKLWSVFFQTRYVLSVAYRAGVVIIESDEQAPSALPVRARNVYAVAARPPRLLAVVVRPAPGRRVDPVAPIFAEADLRLLGSDLAGDDIRVLIDDEELAPAADDVRADRIDVTLPAGLRAGVHRARVVHRFAMGTPPTPHRGAASNVRPFLLQPRVTNVAKANVDTQVVDGVERNDADVTLTVSPPIGRRQRVVLLLNRVDDPPAPPAELLAIRAPEPAPGDPDESPQVTVPVEQVRSGTYAVRVLIDGAESAVPAGQDLPELTLP